MKLTLSWLKDHLDATASLAEIVDTLTRIGLEVEAIEDPGAKYNGFVTARVIEAVQHPNADRLRVCMVDAGGAPVQVVCGAPNARTDMKSVFSPVGAPYARWAGLDDPVIDINLTPNRPDATGVAGIARDLAAASLGALKTRAAKPVAGGFDSPISVSLDFAPADTHLCPAFA